MKRILFCLTLLLLLPTVVSATTYYVSTTGNNSWDGTAPAYVSSNTGPWQTLEYAKDELSAGNTLKIRGGIYKEETGFWKVNGTESNPITLTNYEDEKVIIDGNNYEFPSPGTGLMNIDGDYYTIRNLELRYSGGTGIIVRKYSSHTTLDNLYTHHCKGAGITYYGDYGLVKNCRVYYTSTMNEFEQSNTTWSVGIGLRESTCHHTTIQNCTVWDNWGEGISAVKTNYCTIQDNIIYNGHNLIYICSSHHTTIQRNLIYQTEGNIITPYWAVDNVPGPSPHYTHGIYSGDEYLPEYPSYNNTYINNALINLDRAFYMTQMKNCLMTHNTIYGATNVAARFGGDAPEAEGAILKNNIFHKTSGLMSQDSNGYLTPDYNCWSSLPSASLRGAHDIVGDPGLAKTGSAGYGELTAAYFKLLKTSPCINAATVLDEVSEDYWGTPRGDYPDIGAYEYQSSSTPPSCVPADLNCDNKIDVADLSLVASDFGKSSGFNNQKSDTN